MSARAAALAAARACLGTPFVAGAATPGAGMDCAGLIEVALNAAGRAPPPRADLPEDPAAALGRLLAPTDAPAPGDVLAFAREPGGAADHLAILAAPDRILHAHWSRGVVENRLGGFFARRLAGAWSLDPSTSET